MNKLESINNKINAPIESKKINGIVDTFEDNGSWFSINDKMCTLYIDITYKNDIDNVDYNYVNKGDKKIVTSNPGIPFSKETIRIHIPIYSENDNILFKHGVIGISNEGKIVFEPLETVKAPFNIKVLMNAFIT